MSLKETLDQIRTSAGARIPADKLAAMAAATTRLRESGILDGVVRVGSPLPPFALANADGDIVRSSQLLDRGAVVLTVFRGHW
jgi:hypothetical protein